jgi:TonB family protein
MFNGRRWKKLSVRGTLAVAVALLSPVAAFGQGYDTSTLPTADPQPRPNKPLFLTLMPDLTLMLGYVPVGRDVLGSTLDAETSGDKDTRIFLRADSALPYRDVMDVLKLLQAAGYVKIALVAEDQPVPRTSEAILTWRTQVVALLERNKRYPETAQSRGEQGVAQVFFTLDRQGRVIDSRLRSSSGVSALDEEAVALVRRAQPFPPPPSEMPGERVDLTVPIRFNINKPALVR